MTIIEDSIIKHIMGIDGCTVQSFRGDTISKMTRKIEHKIAKVLPHDFVIVHVGTNDIYNRASFDDIIKDYYNLIATIKSKHSSVQVIVSAIIPRPCDYYGLDSMVRAVNSHLNEVTSKDLNFICVHL